MYGCLYTAFSQDDARAEHEKYLQRAGAAGYPLKPRDLVSIEVDLEPVADLTDEAAAPVPPDTPFLTGDEPDDLEDCRKLADALRADGYVGIIAPSSAAPGEKNLVIYIDGPADSIQLDDGGDRVPL